MGCKLGSHQDCGRTGKWGPYHLTHLLLTPGLAQDTDPILVGELSERLVVVASVPERRHQPRQARHVAYLLRDQNPIEVRAEADPVNPDSLYQVVDLPDHHFQRSARIPGRVLAEEVDREVEADHPVGGGYGVELRVREVSGGGAEGVSVGVARNEWSIRESCHIPEASLIQVGHIDHNAEVVAGANQVPTGSG